jgi:hypothetical protein
LRPLAAARPLVALVLLAAPPAFPEPVVPGFSVEGFAAVPGPEQLAFDAAGNLYTGRGVPGGVGNESQKIHRVPAGGGVGTEYGNDAIDDPDAVLVDEDGSISGSAGAVLVAGRDTATSDGKVVAILPDESVVPVVGPTAALSNPNVLARGRDGLVISDSDPGIPFLKLVEYAPPGPPTTLVDSPSAPADVEVDAAYRMFVAHADGLIRVYDADGALVDGDYAGDVGASAYLALGPGGAFGTDLYATRRATGELLRIAPDGTHSVVGSGFPTGSDWQDIEFGPDGALYTSLFTAGEVLRIAPAPALDSFLCYKARPTKGSARFEPRDVTLADAFESRETEVLKPKALCNPSDRDGAGIGDETAHFESYQIRSSEKHEKVPSIAVVNSLGSLTLATVKEDRLLVPSAKLLPVSRRAVVIPELDHFKCYKAKVAKGTPKLPKGVQVTLADQFDPKSARTFDVKKPKHLCLPVDKNGEGIKNPDGHLLCYQVTIPRGQPKHVARVGVHVGDQFGGEQLNTIKEEELCVPSTKSGSIAAEAAE